APPLRARERLLAAFAVAARAGGAAPGAGLREPRRSRPRRAGHGGLARDPPGGGRARPDPKRQGPGTPAGATRKRIDQIVASDRVVLFMKGTREMPQCGFSAAVVQILDSLVPEYTTVDVLADPRIREGIKAYSSWPTIPQLYLGGEFVGG